MTDARHHVTEALVSKFVKAIAVGAISGAGVLVLAVVAFVGLPVARQLSYADGGGGTMGVSLPVTLLAFTGIIGFMIGFAWVLLRRPGMPLRGERSTS